MKKIIFTMVMGMGLVFSSNGQALKVAANGNVGIGTANPSVALQIERSAFSGLIVRSTTETSQIRMQGLVTGFVFDDQNGNLKSRFEYNDVSKQFNFFNDANGAINFKTNNKQLYWTGAGNLGVGTASPTENLHVIGSAGKTVGGSAWTVLSDRRLKQDIREYDGGLNEVLAINPVTFHYNGKFGTDPTEEVVGVVAQDIQEIAPYMIKKAILQSEERIDENGQRSKGESGEYLTYNANALQYMLVNAIKEQQKIIDDKDAKLQELSNQVKQIQEDLTKVLELVDYFDAHDIKVGVIKSEVEIKGSELASLSQNRPNPFNQETIINYEIPLSAQKAEMNFYNPSGQLIKTIHLNHTGNGELTFKASDVPAGVYSYSLNVDGIQISTKQMVLSK